ncbi:hypothetical protein F383_01406 [Gossypium arboreum]|uniref:Uncharacterized protein n=1 Tax=Gossypium arboreum TaxID=29729 RepID=A0A0B0NGB7_GOSAR|nr:hypothetical protein F383_01406 [Gossypium arboreum]
MHSQCKHDQECGMTSPSNHEHIFELQWQL